MKSFTGFIQPHFFLFAFQKVLHQQKKNPFSDVMTALEEDLLETRDVLWVQSWESFNYFRLRIETFTLLSWSQYSQSTVLVGLVTLFIHCIVVIMAVL